jgi:hypothetical protein
MLPDGANPCVMRRISDNRRSVFDPCLLPFLIGMVEIEGIEKPVDGIAEILLS